MLIIKRADGTRIAIETQLISAVEEAPAPNHLTQSNVYAGSHRHTVDIQFDAMLAAKEENESGEGDLELGEPIPETIDAHGVTVIDTGNTSGQSTVAQ